MDYAFIPIIARCCLFHANSRASPLMSKHWLLSGLCLITLLDYISYSLVLLPIP